MKIISTYATLARRTEWDRDMMTGRAIFLALVLAVAPMAGHAQDFERGVAAYEAGDFEAALRVWVPLAEKGDAWAQFLLGSMYVNGKGVPENHVEAVRWYRLAAEQGEAFAQYNLGIMYVEGEGVPQDYAEAVRWYRLAAEQGLAAAQFNLGAMYADGRGVPQDFAETSRWYRLAAEQGNVWAQTSLGFMYVNGRGVPQDYVTAHMWFNLAGANGDWLAAEAREEIGKRMTPAGISEAQRLARLCMESGYTECGR